MNIELGKEIENLIRELGFTCTINEFKDEVDWTWISTNQKLSEDFIREFKDLVDWNFISDHQKLSEEFIREFKDKVDWLNVSFCQKLSEDFIIEFKDSIIWKWIACPNKLSENFIREFKDKVDWYCISTFQELTEEFLEEFKDEININDYYVLHKKKSQKQKFKEVKEYAKNHSLEFDGQFLYAYRNHDQFGRGNWNRTIFHRKGEYYKDWHCNMDKYEENSFGLVIWPRGNTLVKVKVEDWGVELGDWKIMTYRKDGKARVWGFEVL